MQPNETFLDLINNGDTERLASFHYGNMARTGGSIMVAPNGVAFDDYNFKRELLQPRADCEPADIDEALRWCVLVDDIPQCEADTAVIVYLDRATGHTIIAALCGPAHDHNVAIRIVARDLKAEQTDEPPRKIISIEAEPAPRQAANDNRPTSFNARDLMAMEFEPVRYVVPGYIAEGCTILAGAPKLGKSWLVLQAAMAVARGGYCLGGTCEQGDVLMLALEDNPRRLKDRLRMQNPTDGVLGLKMPENLQFETEWPQADRGGITKIEEWLKAHPNAKLVIIDVLKMFRAARKGNKNAYDLDYEDIRPLTRVANLYKVAIVVVHHTNKGAHTADPFDRVSGTGGISGAADATLTLERNEAGVVQLYGRGRDIEEIDTAVSFQKSTCTWTVRGDAAEVSMSDTAARIVRAMKDADEPMGPAAIATASGVKPVVVRQHLPRLAKEGRIQKEGRGMWVIAGKVTEPSNPPLQTSQTSQPESPDDESNECNESNEGFESPLHREAA